MSALSRERGGKRVYATVTEVDPALRVAVERSRALTRGRCGPTATIDDVGWPPAFVIPDPPPAWPRPARHGKAGGGPDAVSALRLPGGPAAVAPARSLRWPTGHGCT